MAQTKYLDYDGLVAVWGKVKSTFIAQPAMNSVTAGNVVKFTKDTTNNIIGVEDSGYTIGKSVPSSAVFTDEHVTSAANHYVASGATEGTLGSSTARYYIKTITTDAAGHVTGVTTGNETVENSNSASLKVVAADSKVTTDETSSSYIVFTGGTNKFTVSDATANNSFDVTITPSIADNVTGTGTSGSLAIWNGTNTISSRTISTDIDDNNTNIPTAQAVKTYVDSATLGLTGAMHFIGVTTTTLATGDTTDPIAGEGLSKTTGFASGDVVLSGDKEFVWTGATTGWVELGDEGSYALKTVSITGTGALSGGGALSEDRVITHNTSGVTAGSYGQSSNVTGSDGTTVSIPYLTIDSYGHVTSASSLTYTAVDHTYSASTGLNLSGSAFSLKTAATGEIGGVKASNVLNSAVTLTSADGATDNRYYGVQVDSAGLAFVNIPWQVNTDSYISAGSFSSEGTNGADGGKIALTRSGTSATTINITMPLAAADAAGLMSGAQYTKLAGIADNATAVVESTVSGWGFTKNTGTVINSDNLTTDNIVLGAGTVNVKNSGKSLTTTAPSSASGDTTVPTSAAVWSAISNASGYGYVGTVTSITPGDGLFNGSGTKTAITDSGTLKAALTDYTAATYSAQSKASSETRIYAVELDKDGYLAVTVPWTDTTYGSISSEEINSVCVL